MSTKRKGKGGTDLVPGSAEDKREFRKTNEAIGLRVREGKLSLLGRKVFNVMMYHAQQLKEPGRNAPIESAAAKKYFWIPLSDIARDARYDSNDTEYLKQQLEELQNIKLLMENERQWTSERLVASVTLVNPSGLKRHGGQVWFGFAFPPEVHELVMAPGTYTRLSIFYQGLLRSGASLALYEICRRYATNPSHMTSIETYEHWYGVLTGNPVAADSLPPYKYFKRDVLKPAIAEINALTDIQIELVEHKSARRVERLQFRVHVANQSQLEFPAPPVIDLELLGRLMNFGFNQNEASDLMAQHSDTRLRATATAVDARMAQKGGSKLESPAAYFRWCLKQDNLPVPALAESAAKPATSKKARGPSLMERFHDARAKEALGLFDEMHAPDRLPVMARFKAAHPDHTVVKRDGDLEVPMMRAVFGHWYAMDLWGEPSAEDLAAFVEQSAR